MIVNLLSGEQIRLVGFIAPVEPPTFAIPAFERIDVEESTQRGAFSRTALLIQDICDGERTTFIECEVDTLTLAFDLGRSLFLCEGGKDFPFSATAFDRAVGKGVRLFAYVLSNGNVALGQQKDLAPYLDIMVLRSDELPRFRRVEVARFLGDRSQITAAVNVCANVLSEYSQEKSAVYRELALIDAGEAGGGVVSNER